MSRLDLLSLSPDDLATLANRGLVKRAQSELENGSVEGTPTENASGTVSVLWSDDVHCLLPASKPLQEAQCSCAASGICRHLIRSVLAYQLLHQGAPAVADETVEIAETPPVIAWNPGVLGDEEITKIVAAATLKRARKLWDDGQLIEVTTGARPTARFHSLGANTRFLVPGDARYSHCDCAQSAPCVHVPLAIWAFRRLENGAQNGLISTRSELLSVPLELLDGIENLIGELASVGVASAGQFADKLARLEGELRAGELVWPAEIVGEIGRQIEWHDAHNARFDATRVAQLAGELLARADAIRAQTGAVPDQWLRGAALDKPGEVGAATLIGLGAQARFYRGGVELRAFLQDADSGAVVFLSHDFSDPTPDASRQFLRGPSAPVSPQSLAKLSASPRIKGSSLGAVAGGQLLARGGKRAPSGALNLGRAPLSVNAQSYNWEKLRAPVLAEGFGEIAAHLDAQAPAFLRPRRAGENLYVAPISGVENAHFESATQSVRALVRDANGATATLIHPFTARGAQGVEALLQTLNSSDETVCFVAGHFESGGAGLAVAPLALVVEKDGKRRLLQPWIAGAPATSSAPMRPEADAPDEPLRDWARQLDELLGETMLLGLKRADELLARAWHDLEARGASLGLERVLASPRVLRAELERKSRVKTWDESAARAALGQTLVLAQMLAAPYVHSTLSTGGATFGRSSSSTRTGVSCTSMVT